MFIKSLTIYNDNGVIRDIPFHKGLNLIVDNTPDAATDTGNNVGKTTVLRLIDFCLGKDGRAVYTDPANPKVEHQEVKQFLLDTNVIIELVLTTDFERRDVVIRRNFKKRSEAIREINGINIKDEAFENELERAILGIQINKPTFRQIISHNIRYSDQSVSDVLKTVNAFTSDAEYETLYLFLFGCRFDKGDLRQAKLDKLKTDLAFKSRLEKQNSKSTYLSLLGLVNAHIERLQQEKSQLNINPNFAADMDELTHVKYRINGLSSDINSLHLRREMILDAQRELDGQKSDIDLVQLELIYKQAGALIPNLQHTFEELVAYHNQMLDNKVRFISKSLPKINEQLGLLQEELNRLLQLEDKLTQKVVKSNTYEDLEKLINELNGKYQEKGQYESIIQQIEAIESEISQSESEINAIDESLFSDAFRNHIQEQIDKFNVLFSYVSKRLYGEEYALQFEPVVNQKTKKSVYKFSSFNANLSTGKKMGEISCFDIAYIMFARKEGIPCLNFLLNDKKELMSDNQLVSIGDIVEEENIQFVASILRDKLPTQLNRQELFVVELAQDDKLFRI